MQQIASTTTCKVRVRGRGSSHLEIRDNGEYKDSLLHTAAMLQENQKREKEIEYQVKATASQISKLFAFGFLYSERQPFSILFTGGGGST